MQLLKTVKLVLLWIPSLVVAYFFLDNGLTKIFFSSEMDKIGASTNLLISTGILLVLAVALFLSKKTLIYGTAFLVLYMIAIVFIHISKGKPFLLTASIVLLTLFAAYLRKTQLPS